MQSLKLRAGRLVHGSRRLRIDRHPISKSCMALGPDVPQSVGREAFATQDEHLPWA